MSGTIPVELGNLTSLESLHLHSNQLSGTIPVELGNLTSLEVLWLAANQLSGTIPVELGNLTSLSWLWLGDNQLSGTIPAELGNLTRLTRLQLGDNQLSGQIPAALGKLTSLLDLSIDTTTGLCLAPDFDLTSPFATLSGLPVCTAVPALPAVAVALLGLLLAAGARRRATRSLTPQGQAVTFGTRPSPVQLAVVGAGVSIQCSVSGPIVCCASGGVADQRQVVSQHQL